MKSNPAVPGGSLTSKPTWSNTFGCSATSAFFVLGSVRRTQLQRGESRNGGATLSVQVFLFAPGWTRG